MPSRRVPADPKRLDAFIAHNTALSRNRARKLVQRGAVAVDGMPCRDPGLRIHDQTVSLEGTELIPLPDRVHLVLHKPPAHACSHDPAEAPLIFDLLPARYAPLRPEPAGRLDRNTTGLLVMTSDGQLLHRLIHPRHKVDKRYRVRYRGRLPADAVARVAAGLPLPDDRPARPAELHMDDPPETHPARPAALDPAVPVTAADGRATLTLREGRFHQVRHMFAALGVTVTALHRDRIGACELPADLPPGGIRELTDAEVAALEPQ